MTDANADHGVVIPYEAFQLAKARIGYGKDVRSGIQHMKHYSDEELKAKEIVNDKGEVNGMKLWEYINDHISAPARQKHFGDAREYRLIPRPELIEQLTTQYAADKDALIDALATQYAEVGRQVGRTKFGEALGAQPIYKGKPAVETMSMTTGDYEVLKKLIASRTDPQGVAAVGAQVYDNLDTKIEQALAAGTAGDIEKKLVGTGTHG